MLRHGARTSVHLATRFLVLIQMGSKLLMCQSSFQWGVQPALVPFPLSPQATPIHFGVAPHRVAIFLLNALRQPLSIHPVVPLSCLLSRVLNCLPPRTLLILQLKRPPTSSGPASRGPCHSNFSYHHHQGQAIQYGNQADYQQ